MIFLLLTREEFKTEGKKIIGNLREFPRTSIIVSSFKTEKEGS